MCIRDRDGPGNVKSVDLLRETVKVSLDSAPEPLKCYHNCEVCVLRNGKGSREGIAIPERPARYVEPKEAEEFREEAPALMPPFYMDTQLEEAPMREPIRCVSETAPRCSSGLVARPILQAISTSLPTPVWSSLATGSFS